MPDDHPGGPTVGLTQALEQYFGQQFAARRDNGGKTCPGEEICVVTGPLRDKSRPIEAICQACPLRHTKPGSIPTQIAQLVITAYRMEALFEAGAGSPYPEGFSTLEWEAFLALLYARGRDQEKDFQKKKAAHDQHSEEVRLKQRLNRG